jgi:hypothetical protein
LFHPHGIEEENGGMGCFYVVPSSSTAVDANHICSLYIRDPHAAKAPFPTSTIFGTLTDSLMQPVTDKSKSMIDKQYELQKELQMPFLIYGRPHTIHTGS